MRHPAKFSKSLLPILFEWVGAERGPVLDPMAGVGSAKFCPDMLFNEIEPEWAAQCPGSVTVADASNLPYPSESIGCIVTSCTYGNRMADKYAGDPKGSTRHTYRIYLGRPLTAGNTGAMQWGEEYRRKHLEIWEDCIRVLRPGGALILNVSDHVRRGEVAPVANWHRSALGGYFGLKLEEVASIETPRQRHGANGALRVEAEMIYRFRK